MSTRVVYSGSVTHAAFRETVNEGATFVYEFKINDNPLLFSFSCYEGERHPVVGDSVLAFLHERQDKWPGHTKEVVFEVPERIASNAETVA